MAKRAAAVAGLVAYAALASWIVHEEGVAYRASLRKKEPPAASPAVEVVAAPTPSPHLETPPPAPTDPPAPAPKSVEPPETVAARVEPRTPAPAPVAPAPTPVPPKPDPFWLTPRMKEVWDPEKLTPADERRLGAALKAMVLSLEKPHVGGEYLERAEQAAAPLIAAGKRKDGEFHFTILDSDAVNAFSHPGGYIYLSKGLFDFIGRDKDEDFVLQFVIAHELAHLELGHAVRCLKDPDLARSGLGSVPQFALFLIPMGYPDAMEREADRLAYDRMTRTLDRTRHEALAFLRRYKGYAERNGFPNGREGLVPVPGASPLDNHLRAHPAPWKRIDALTPKAAGPAR